MESLLDKKMNRQKLMEYLDQSETLPESCTRKDAVNYEKLAIISGVPIRYIRSKNGMKIINAKKNSLKIKPAQNISKKNFSIEEFYNIVKVISEKDYKSCDAILTVFKKIISSLNKKKSDNAGDIFRIDNNSYKININIIFESNKHETKIKYVKLGLKLKEYYDGCIYSSSLPDGFADAIKEVHMNSGLSIRQVERIANIKRDSAKNIIRGINTPSNYKIVLKLEKAYNLPAFTLLNKLPKSVSSEKIELNDFPLNFRSKISEIRPHLCNLNFNFKTASEEKKEEVCKWVLENIIVCNNTYSMTCAKNFNNAYSYKHLDQSIVLQKELRDLINFKESIIPNLHYNKLSSWNPSSSEKNKKSILYFIGFVDKYKKIEYIERSDYSITLFLHKEVVHDYIQFKIAKRGRISSDDMQFLALICSLLTPKYGYMYQTKFYNNKDIIKKLIDIGVLKHNDVEICTDNGWKNFCKDTRCYYLELIKQINSIYKNTQIDRNGSIAKSRDPFKPIAPILNSKEPIREYLSLLCEARRQFIPVRSNPKSFISFMSGYLSLMIILQTALRAKNIRCLEYTIGEVENKEQIYKKNNKYYVDVPANRVKNSQRTDVEIVNTNNLYDDIDAYIALKNSFFSDENNNFIVSTDNNVYTEGSFSRMIRYFTKLYICYHKYRKNPGIENLQSHGPHALRDIIATHVIKKTGSFALAAIAIRNTEQTVRKHYARFLPSDKADLFREITSDIF